MCYWAWHILWKYINLNISFWMNFQMILITCQNRWHFLHIRNYLHIIYERFYCIKIYLIAYNEGEHSKLNSSWCYNGFVINSLVSSWLAITFWVWVGLEQFCFTSLYSRVRDFSMVGLDRMRCAMWKGQGVQRKTDHCQCSRLPNKSFWREGLW